MRYKIIQNADDKPVLWGTGSQEDVNGWCQHIVDGASDVRQFSVVCDGESVTLDEYCKANGIRKRSFWEKLQKGS